MYTHHNRCRKASDKIEHSFMKEFPLSGHRGKLLKGKNWKDFLQDQEQDKDIHLHHFYSNSFRSPRPMAIREEK